MNDLTSIIHKIHDSPVQAVLVITGGGTRAISELLSVPGASRTLFEARVPYSAAALTDFLASTPEHFCSPETARALAVTAYLRAKHLAGGATAGLPNSAAPNAPPLNKGGRKGAGQADAAKQQHPPLAGIACTASLVSDRPKKGPHRCHVAVHDATSTTTYSLELTKGLRDRPAEEEVVARLILAAAARRCSVADEVPLGLADDERIESRCTEAPPATADLFAGASLFALVRSDGAIESPSSDTSGTGVSPVQIAALLPGAFHPLHEGHRELARVAAEILSAPVAYEISLFNVDKPPLNFTDLEDRLDQFKGEADVVLTRAPTFLEKARVLPGCTFVVGYDTALRIVAPRYYGGEDEMLAALDEMHRLATRFLVAGRLDDQRYCTLADLTIPDGYADLFQPIPEDRFRRDISSTALRAAANLDTD